MRAAWRSDGGVLSGDGGRDVLPGVGGGGVLPGGEGGGVLPAAPFFYPCEESGGKQ